MKTQPLISVCIPVYDTEPYLAQCLHSVLTQDFDSFEIVIVSDASCGRDEKGWKAKKIIQHSQKECNKIRKSKELPPVPVTFIENRENRGLIEVRRLLCTKAHGEYITQLDSDDQMVEGALSSLYKTAREGNFDIVHGTSTAGVFDKNGSFTPAEKNRCGTIFYGTLSGHDVFYGWLIKKQFTANTWGKLIKRKLWVDAYNNIPYTECNMADDVLLFFFLAQYAKSYIGIENKVYRYRINTGMSSSRKIDNLRKWKMICSAASVFTVISEWIKEKPDALSEEEVNQIRKMTRFYLANNLQQMRDVVIPELQPAAREMLCDFWGESFVNKIEKSCVL